MQLKFYAVFKRKQNSHLSSINANINILIGEKKIDTDNGGGCRKIQLNNYDELDEIREKITNVYFEGNNEIFWAFLKQIIFLANEKLGEKSGFLINLLDFKKEIIQKSHFKNLENYMKDNGLTGRHNLFYLQLVRCLNFRIRILFLKYLDSITRFKYS
jgi:hypothetical protein